jgi:hypothetical protein
VFRRRRYGLLEGDLVRVSSFRRIRFASGSGAGVPPTPDDWNPGIVLSIYDSNVYEGASAEVLMGDVVVMCEARDLTVLEPVDA